MGPNWRQGGVEYLDLYHDRCESTLLLSSFLYSLDNQHQSHHHHHHRPPPYLFHHRSLHSLIINIILLLHLIIVVIILFCTVLIINTLIADSQVILPRFLLRRGKNITLLEFEIFKINATIIFVILL